PDSDAIARHPRLGDLEDRLADPVPVADAEVTVGKTGDGEVLAELPGNELVSAQLLFPVAIRLELVDHHRPLLTAVATEVTLAVAVEGEPSPHHRARGRCLPGAG